MFQEYELKYTFLTYFAVRWQTHKISKGEVIIFACFFLLVPIEIS